MIGDPPNWSGRCPTCYGQLGSGGCPSCGSVKITWIPKYPDWYQPPPIPYTWPVFVPAVCSGSGWVAIDWQGTTYRTSIELTGECGICHQRVKVDSNGCCVTHPYESPKTVG